MTVIYSFPQLNAGASATLTLGADGNFYGTTAANGLNGQGHNLQNHAAGRFWRLLLQPVGHQF